MVPFSLTLYKPKFFGHSFDQSSWLIILELADLISTMANVTEVSDVADGSLVFQIISGNKPGGLVINFL